MRILVLAPQPFFQERGTPIAVDLMVRALARRGHEVDLLVYHEGEDREIQGVTIHRIRKPPLVRRVGPGFSLKKVVCDVFLLAAAHRLVKQRRPQLIHAVEESVFVAALLGKIYGIPYVYDMDSSLPDQMVEKLPALRPIRGLMAAMVRPVLRGALMIAPVCDALAGAFSPEMREKTVILRDVSLLEDRPPGEPAPSIGPRARDACRFMYIGNLEAYQGIDLLLHSFALHVKERPQDHLVIIGGFPAHVERYRTLARDLGLGGAASIPGAQPVNRMTSLIQQTDVLVSPRVKGNNTPMKIYSYLDSGKAIVATNLFTHTQVLTPDIAVLCEPTPAAFAAGTLALAKNPALRKALSERAREVVRSSYSKEAFDRSMDLLYGRIEAALAAPPPAA